MTRKPPAFHPDAREEYAEALVYHEDQRDGYGLKFEEEVLTTLERIRVFPSSGSVVEGCPEGVEVRTFPIRRFPYSLFVVLEGEHSTVYAVAHQRRRPGYWHDRLGR